MTTKALFTQLIDFILTSQLEGNYLIEALESKYCLSEKINLEDKKQNFGLSLSEFKNDYPREMLKDFRDYWCEASPNGKKLRYEKEKVFDIKLRLIRWSKNNKNGVSKNGHGIDSALDFADKVLRGEITDPNFRGNTE